jgi:nitrogen fixation protein
MDIGTPLIEVTLTEEEAVDGYRMWFLIPVKGRRLLAPVALDMHRPWNSGGPSTAICVLPESDRLPVGPGFHEAPVAACRCGLYAMGELNAVVGGGGMDWEERLRSAVLGKARLWGRTIVGPNGWRAEFARVAELLSLPGQEEIVREMASAYGVPVKLLPEPIRFEGGPLDGSIRFGTPIVNSFITTFHDYSFVPDRD